jgi:CDP-diacylglycerol pyrophosphatase
MRVLRILAAVGVLLLPFSRADVRTCQCDVARPETMDARECSLCKEAEKQPGYVSYFALRDTNPTKPNRWIMLPRFHGNHPQQLLEMTPAQRTGYWAAAIDKAQAEWGDTWGIALNGTEKRTQCHIHIHIGKLLPDMENDHFVVVDGPAQIPVPKDGDGEWVHPAGGKLHVHTDEQAGELKLQR